LDGLVFEHFSSCYPLRSGGGNEMADLGRGANVGEIQSVTEEFVRGYVKVLRGGGLASADECYRLLLARAKAKELLSAAAFDQAVELAHSFGGTAN
jgi:hypothetical protein